MRWGQLGNPSSHWTIALSNQWFWVALGFLTFFHLILSLYLPLAEDEIYYWTWARPLQWSYFDHPPLVAYLIRLSSAFFGNNPFGIRFFAVVFSSVILAIVGHLCRDKQVAGFLLFTPLFFWGAPLMTPDVPLALFWSLYLWWFIQCNHTLSQWSGDPITRVYRREPVPVSQWVLGGMCLGMGMLGKYTMVLAAPCAFLALITRYRVKGWIRGFTVHLVVGALFCTGVFLYNLKLGFAPFKFQIHHAFMESTTLREFGLFLLSQCLLFGLMPLMTLPAVLFRARDLARDPRLHACIYFSVPLFLYFLLQAMRSHLEANWTIVAYIAFWPIAQSTLSHGWFRHSAFRYLFTLFLPPLVVVVLLGIHLTSPLGFIPPERDRIGRLRAQDVSMKQVADIIFQNNPPPVIAAPMPVYASTYQLVSYLRYHGVSDAMQMPGLMRPNTFVELASDPCQVRYLVFVSSNPAPSLPPLACRMVETKKREVPVIVRGKTLFSYYIWWFST